MADTAEPQPPGPGQRCRDVRDVLDGRLPDHQRALEHLVRIPSVSASGFDPAHVQASADAVCELLAAAGLAEVQLLDVPGAHSAVYGEWTGAGEDAPVVLLYAHHDVQPPGSAAGWTSPPFEPEVREGRLYGRGSADDKAGVLVHVAAVDAWLRARRALPCNVKVFVEGEEETGSEHLDAFLERHGELLRADVVVVTDSYNWRAGVPAITYLLRGLVDCEVTLRGLDHGLHSGAYGGPVPDPLTGLVKLLAGLTDEHGAVAIPGFSDDVRRPTPQEQQRIAALDFDLDTFRREAGLLPGVELTGDPGAHPLERLWLQPSAAIIGLDATPVAESSNTITPQARARVSVRLAPGQDPQRALDRLCRWLREHAPWGLHADVTPGTSAAAFVADPEGPAFEAAGRALEAAFGRRAVLMGVGGTIPLVEPLTRAGRDPSAAQGPSPALLLAVADPDSRAHGLDESLPLDDWARACLAEVYLLDELARSLAGPRP